MNVILGLCHSYSGKVVTFQESLFVCKRKLSKTSRLLRRAATKHLLRPDLQKCGVVYQVTCPQCQHLYVGETGRTLATRMKDHTSHNTQPTAAGLNARSAKPSKSRPYSQPSTETRDSTCPRSTAKFYLSVLQSSDERSPSPDDRGSCQ